MNHCRLEQFIDIFYWSPIRHVICTNYFHALLFLLIDAILCSCPDNTVPWSNGSCKPVEDAVIEATEFLKQYMPKFDKPNEATLFEGGIVIPTVNISLSARQNIRLLQMSPLIYLWTKFKYLYRNIKRGEIGSR